MFVFDITHTNLINVSNVDTLSVFEAQTGEWEIRAYSAHGSWILGTFDTKREAQVRLVQMGDLLTGADWRSEDDICEAYEL